MSSVEELQEYPQSGIWPKDLRSVGSAPCILGIDEAGRGPVLGPMVYGACYTPLSNETELSKLGFADSKTLNDERRENLFKKIRNSDSIGWIVNVLSASELSASMLQTNKYNLNSISHDTAAGLIQKVLDSGVNIQQVYVDTVGDSERYEEKLSRLFPSIQFCVRKKADSLYPIVSAASICAKVTRDRSLLGFVFSESDWKKCLSERKLAKLAEDDKARILSADGEQLRAFGSGYPGDAVTKAWLAANGDPVFGYPSIVRFSWSTTTLLLDQNAHEFKWAADDEEDAAQTKLSFSSAGNGTSQGRGCKRSSAAAFLAERSLEPACSL